MAGGRPARKLAGGRPARRNHRSTAPAPNHIEVAASRLAVGKPGQDSDDSGFKMSGVGDIFGAFKGE